MKFLKDVNSEGWQTNLEYVLWNAVINGERKYGQSLITAYDIDELRKLSKACNSWIYFDDENEETAIDMGNWEIMVESEVKNNPNIVQR